MCHVTHKPHVCVSSASMHVCVRWIIISPSCSGLLSRQQAPYPVILLLLSEPAAPSQDPSVWFTGIRSWPRSDLCLSFQTQTLYSETSHRLVSQMLKLCWWTQIRKNAVLIVLIISVTLHLSHPLMCFSAHLHDVSHKLPQSFTQEVHRTLKGNTRGGGCVSKIVHQEKWTVWIKIMLVFVVSFTQLM